MTEIVTDDDAARVGRVEVATLQGDRYSVRARAFVLATGGLEVPRLLLATNRVRPAGLGNEHDLVGRHFTEHLQVPLAVSVTNRPKDAFRLYEQRPFPHPEVPDRELAIKGVLTLPSPEVIRREMLGLEAQLVFGGVIESAPTQDVGLTASATAALLEATEREPVSTVGLMVAVGEQSLDPDSRVTLSPTARDALGMPELVLDWRYGERDRASMLTGLRVMVGELARAGVARAQILPGAMRPDLGADLAGDPTQLVTVDPTAIDPDGFEFGISNHHMCTTRMDPDPRRGVVDTDGKVHSVANLYVAGSAVFPTGGVAPPTLTIVALALRLADHLRGEHS